MLLKLDLVMWTLNSALTLKRTLSSLKTIPEDRVCHKMIIDGGSVDATESVAKDFGWEFHRCKRGLFYQANFGLDRVDTQMYATFEHDILLSPQWLPRMEELLGKPDVAVAQGIRLITGNGALEAMYRWMYDRSPDSIVCVSIDNTLYKTDAVRAMGGYPFDNSWGNHTDGALWSKITKHHLRWVVDTHCVSGHLRPSFRKHLKHLMLYETMNDQRGYSDFLTKLSFSPLRGIQISRRYHEPSALLGYPVFRYFFTLLAAARGNLSSRGNAEVDGDLAPICTIDDEGFAEYRMKTHSPVHKSWN